MDTRIEKLAKVLTGYSCSLKPGEKVVIEGLQRIRPGVPVQIVPTIAEQEQAKAAKASKQ